jgi:4-hydroxy-tetrahydrodipicolinate synthase
MDNRIFELRGPRVALPTPFRNGVVDACALEMLCHHQIRHGTAALVPGGATGEAPLLTPGDHHHVVERAVVAAAGRVPVIAGVAGGGTQASVDLARSAKLAGAHALLCVTPFHMKPTQEGLIAHFKAIHDAVRLPIIVHDVPPRIGGVMADFTIRRLAELPRIVGLTDEAGDIERLGRLRSRLSDRFLLLTGDDATQAAHRQAGGNGCISVTANVAPALCAALYKACDRGDSAAVARLDGILAPLYAALFLEASPIPVKRALHRLGLLANELRLPLTPLGPLADAKLARALEAVMPAEKAAQTTGIVPNSPMARPRAA